MRRLLIPGTAVALGVLLIATAVVAQPDAPAQVAIAAPPDTTAPTPAILRPATTEPVPAERASLNLDELLQPLLADFDGQITVAVSDHGVTYDYQPQTRLRTASVVKVAILAELLLTRGELTATEKYDARSMITTSDNDAATRLWEAIGGPDGINDLTARLGLTGTVPGTDGAWGVTTTTAADQVRLLDTVTRTGGILNDNAVALMTDLLSSVTPDQRWGVQAAARDGEQLLVKDGWMTWDDQDGQWSINSIGRITGTDTDLTLAVLTTGHTDMETGVALVEAVCTTIRDTLTP